MSSAQYQQGYNRARADMACRAGFNEILEVGENLRQRRATNQWVAQVNAVHQDIQSRLQASEETVRFLDQANADLCEQLQNVCAQLQEWGAKLQEWDEYGKKSQAIMASQREKIAMQDRIINDLNRRRAIEAGF